MAWVEDYSSSELFKTSEWYPPGRLKTLQTKKYINTQQNWCQRIFRELVQILTCSSDTVCQRVIYLIHYFLMSCESNSAQIVVEIRIKNQKTAFFSWVQRLYFLLLPFSSLIVLWFYFSSFSSFIQDHDKQMPKNTFTLALLADDKNSVVANKMNGKQI